MRVAGLIILCLVCLAVPSSGRCKSAKSLYFKAEAAYHELRRHPEHQKYRSYWQRCIDSFSEAYRRHPNDPWAPAAMFMSAKLHEELYAHSYNPKDRRRAADIYQRLISTYPKSRYRDRSEARMAALGDAIGEVIAGSKRKDRSKRPESAVSDGKTTTVTGIRYWSNPDYTRVVIDADRETTFKNNLLKRDPSIRKPYPRLYVDLADARLGEVEKKIPINDSLLRAARAGQYSRDTVRVVVDIKSFSDYKIFSLKNPFRIVIDVRGEQSPARATAERPNRDAIISPLCLGVERIVIDPGHGGKDYGAPGYLRGVHEKDVVLAISKKLAERLQRKLGCEVLLTRKDDTYLTLEERTAIANTEKADLFLSIHANAARNHRAFGIETYFLNLTTDESAISVAARENATSRKNIGELDSILQDLLNNAKINESSRLATYVQHAMVDHLEGRYNSINDKGVKQAPFYVLLGAQMPSILVETAFISNQMECRRLTDPAYQTDVCDAITQGIARYIDEIQPKAYFNEGPASDVGG
jgi:N-acetylmuramoyl-L-alanine amidase